MPITTDSNGRRKAEAGEDARRSTRNRLLEAAERILITEGTHALSVRRVGTMADLNPTLVTYHFGSVCGLLIALCHLNLDPMVAAWAMSPASEGERLDAILGWWLAPLMRPAAHDPEGRALLVLDEIAAHGEAEPRTLVMEAMSRISEQVQGALGPLLPHFTPAELYQRLRFIAGAALGPPPRQRRQDLVATSMDSADVVPQLIAFARAALSR